MNFLLVSIAVVEARSEDDSLRLAGLFADNMVVQRESDAAFWGWGPPGEEVRVEASWGERAVTAKVDGDGRWEVRVRTPAAGGPFEIDVDCGEESIGLKNVLSGEVWICSGQSNMQWKLRGFGPDEFKDDVARAKYPEIRFCDVPQVLALEEQEDARGGWKVCNPQTAYNFSAVAYFFGSRVHQELDVPVGLISTNWGGSSAEAWVSAEVLEEQFPEFDEVMEKYPELIEEHGAVHPRNKKAPKGLNHRAPSVLYNAMIRPLIPYTIRGVIWYQGESNVKKPLQYRTLFPALIRDWRQQWGLGDFPFYFVQIAPFSYNREPIPAAFLREAQTMALSVANTGMAVTMDVGQADNIHPKAKKPVGERLALLALSRTYGKKLVDDSGPLYTRHQVVGDEVRLEFAHASSGLASRDGEPLSHFTIAGKDRKFVPAEASIKGETIVVRSDEVKKPAAVRFGWGNADAPNLMNKEGLPSPSFRTDDWPIDEP